jgi:ABC-type glycerol-3-phosphate transport system substrate-binding protein
MAAILVLLVAFGVFFFARGDDLDLTRGEPRGAVILREGSYAEFLHIHNNTPSGTERIEVDILTPSRGTGYKIIDDFAGNEFWLHATRPDRNVLWTDETSYVEFNVFVPVAGMYNIEIEYFPVEARGIDIVRELRINGVVPFFGADQLTFSRIWGSNVFIPGGDRFGVRTDSRGNQIRPPQVERPRWETAAFRDRLGHFPEPYRFFFNAGENTIRLTGVNEPLVLRRLVLVPVYDLPTYESFRAATHLRPSQGFYRRIQGQHSTVRSSPSLFPLFDSSSGITYPPSASLITLNMIGGQPWRIPGQWIEWEIEVPADGLYRISVSARQNYNRGFVSSRSVYVNGVIPFAEVAAVPFTFNNSWELITFSDADGTHMLFPLNAGVNILRLEVTLGEMGEVLNRLLDSINRLNQIYRSVLVLTGPDPDPLRDYRIHVRLPHVMEMIEAEAGILHDIARDMIRLVGERNEHIGIISSMVFQLEDFLRRPERIAHRLKNFRENISALADGARILTEGQLDIDFILVTSPDITLPRVRESFLTRVVHETRAFIASFTMDFDSLGEVFDEDDALTIWITTGRDQANILKAMIDDTFVSHTGIGVNLRLVAPGAVLPAVVAGIGPDVVLSVQNNNPIDFAIRNASVDLSTFPDFDEVVTRFAPQAMVPFEFMGGYYALPETMNFTLMFYRSDIFEQLGLAVPQTWNDVMAIMPTLQRNNMQVGIPAIADPQNVDISGLLTQIYQRGGFLYNEDNSRTVLESEAAIEGFDAYTRFFTHFGVPQFYNFLNRFRSGEMPIGFADFTLFNTLSVFAPEIQGAWNFGLMPGVLQDDGTINHTVPAWGTAAVMFSSGTNQNAAWEFLKWWTSKETQLRFGREMESVMGAAARHPTANLEAFNSLPWSTAQLEILNTQRSWVLGTPEVPGGYYVQRSLIFAARRVINDNVDTRETLLDFVIRINRELVNKRREFGLE